MTLETFLKGVEFGYSLISLMTLRTFGDKVTTKEYEGVLLEVDKLKDYCVNTAYFTNEICFSAGETVLGGTVPNGFGVFKAYIEVRYTSPPPPRTYLRAFLYDNSGIFFSEPFRLDKNVTLFSTYILYRTSRPTMSYGFLVWREDEEGEVEGVTFASPHAYADTERTWDTVSYSSSVHPIIPSSTLSLLNSSLIADYFKILFGLDDSEASEINVDDCVLDRIGNATGLAYDSFLNVLCKRDPAIRHQITLKDEYLANESDDNKIVDLVIILYARGLNSFKDETTEELIFSLSLGNLIAKRNMCLMTKTLDETPCDEESQDSPFEIDGSTTSSSDENDPVFGCLFILPSEPLSLVSSTYIPSYPSPEALSSGELTEEEMEAAAFWAINTGVNSGYNPYMDEDGSISAAVFTGGLIK
jgi:hypothetical protein